MELSALAFTNPTIPDTSLGLLYRLCFGIRLRLANPSRALSTSLALLGYLSPAFHFSTALTVTPNSSAIAARVQLFS